MVDIPSMTAKALAKAWGELHPDEEPTRETITDFLFECACIGAETLVAFKELTEQEQD